MSEMSNEELLARIRAAAEEDKKKETAVGTIMKNGGGAAAGAAIGYSAGTVASVALAPLTGGLSILVAPLFGLAGGVMGHKMSKDVE